MWTYLLNLYLTDITSELAQICLFRKIWFDKALRTFLIVIGTPTFHVHLLQMCTVKNKLKFEFWNRKDLPLTTGFFIPLVWCIRIGNISGFVLQICLPIWKNGYVFQFFFFWCDVTRHRALVLRISVYYTYHKPPK